MYVRMNFGPDAGKDIDLAADAAIGLLADGRASRAFQDEPQIKIPEPKAAAASQPALKKAAKRRG